MTVKDKIIKFDSKTMKMSLYCQSTVQATLVVRYEPFLLFLFIALRPTFVGMVNPRHQKKDQLVYLSDGTPVDTQTLNLEYNGYEAKHMNRLIFQLTVDGTIEGIDSFDHRIGYFCQINCSDGEET